MPKLENVPDHVIFRVSVAEKNRLLLLAAQAGKTLSAFCRDAAIATDKTASDGGHAELMTAAQEVRSLLKDNQKMQYIIARLALKIGAEQTGSDEIMKYFRECQSDAEEKFKEG